jgi:hypothetical protein
MPHICQSSSTTVTTKRDRAAWEATSPEGESQGNDERTGGGGRGRSRRNASAARRGARKTSTPPMPLPHSGEHTRSRCHQGNNERRGGGGLPRHNKDAPRRRAGHRHCLISNSGDRTIAAPGNDEHEGYAMCRSRRNAEAICRRAGHQRRHCQVNTKCGTARGEGQRCKWSAAGGWRSTPPNARGPARTCNHRGRSTTLPRPAGRRGGRSSQRSRRRLRRRPSKPRWRRRSRRCIRPAALVDRPDERPRRRRRRIPP